MELVIQRERYSNQLCGELLPLARANWQDSASYEVGVEVEPDWAKYQKLDAADILLCFTLRDEVRLVGYVIYLITPSRRHKSTLCGFGEALYVTPPYRGHGTKLLAAAHQELIKRGVSRLAWAVEKDSPLYKILVACEFYEDEIVMEKKLS